MGLVLNRGRYTTLPDAACEEVKFLTRVLKIQTYFMRGLRASVVMILYRNQEGF